MHRRGHHAQCPSPFSSESTLIDKRCWYLTLRCLPPLFPFYPCSSGSKRRYGGPAFATMQQVQMQNDALKEIEKSAVQQPSDVEGVVGAGKVDEGGTSPADGEQTGPTTAKEVDRYGEEGEVRLWNLF